MSESVNIVPIDEACNRLSLCRNAIYAWIRSGQCPFGYAYVNDGCKRHNYVILRKEFEDRMYDIKKDASSYKHEASNQVGLQNKPNTILAHNESITRED